MIKYYSFFMLVLSIFSVMSPPINASSIIKIPNREMIMVLDYPAEETVSKTLQTPVTHTSETIARGIGAITATCLIALHQETAPLLVSSSLLENIFEHKRIFNDFVQYDRHVLQQKYQGYPRFQTPTTIKLFKEHCVYLNSIYKKVNQELNKLLSNKKEYNDQELYSVVEKIAQDPRFGQHKAPKSLHNAISNAAHQTMHRELMLYCMCWQLAPKANKWIIKQVSDNLCLLIPKKYIKQLGLQESCDYKQASQLSELELTLGLKVNHLQDIKNPQQLFLSPRTTKKKPFNTDLTRIFVSHHEAKKDIPLTWAFYVSGHGLPRRKLDKIIEQLEYLEHLYMEEENKIQRGKSSDTAQLKNIQYHINRMRPQLKQPMQFQEGLILSLSLNEWSQALQFFNEHLSVALLFYTSCYAGGEHLTIPYQDKENKPLLLHYPVIAGTLSENSALQDLPLIMIPPYRFKQNGSHIFIEGINNQAFDVQKRKLGLVTTLHFDTFFNALRSGMHCKEGNLHTLASYLHPYSNDNGNLMYECLGNIPHIRQAGDTTFKIVPSIPSCIMITPEATADVQRPHWLFGKKRAGLLYTSYIPQTVILHKKSMLPPVFISMMPGLASHTFEEVKATAYTLIELINAFLHLPELKSSKIFWIKKLTCAATHLIPTLTATSSSSSLVLDNVIIARNICSTEGLKRSPQYEDEYYNTYVYFTLNNISYRISWSGYKLTEENALIEKHTTKHYQNELYAFDPKLKQHTSSLAKA